MSYDYASMFIQIDSVERRVGQFDVNTIEGRASICAHYKSSNLEFLGNEFDEKLYEEVTEKYIRFGKDALSTSASASSK